MMHNCSKYLLLAFLGIAVVAAGCSRRDGVFYGTASTAGYPDSYPLWVDDQVQVGRVDVWEDWSSSPAALHVKYVLTAPDWFLTECRLAAALSLDSVPQRNGKPIPSEFEWYSGALNNVTEFEFAVPFRDGWSSNRVLYVAPYCELVPYVGGRERRAESGWGGTEPFAGRKWAMYCLYRIGEETPTGPRFRTVTQGRWGAPPESDYWGQYLALHFDQVFCPDLRVGYGRCLLLSDAPSAEAHLPDYGAPAKLTKHYRDPRSNITVFAGQIVALFINVTFDAAYSDFAPSGLLLKDLYVADPASPFYGWTVQQVLGEANKVLGGHGSYTPAVTNVCVTKINENFEDLGDNGFLSVALP
jgi:hypothetical protein